MIDFTQFVPDIVRLAPKESGLLVNLIIIWVLIIISSLPLYLSLKILFGHKVTIFKVFLVNIIGGLIVAIIKLKFETFGGVIAFLLLLFVYKIAFRIGWIRALLAWMLQFVILALFTFILSLIGIKIL